MNDMYSLWIRLFMNDVMNDVKVLYGSESSWMTWIKALCGSQKASSWLTWRFLTGRMKIIHIYIYINRMKIPCGSREDSSCMAWIIFMARMKILHEYHEHILWIAWRFFMNDITSFESIAWVFLMSDMNTIHGWHEDFYGPHEDSSWMMDSSFH